MDPGIAVDVPKNIYTLGHFSGYKYGTNFFSVDILQSLANDPAHRNSTSQAQELYAVYRSALSSRKILGTKYELGPVKDFLLTFGFDAGAKDTTFAPRPFKLLIGPTVNIALPVGFLDLSLLAYNETNNNGIVGKKVDFDTTWQVGALWGTFFNLGLPAKFTGFISVTGPKGKDGFGVQTVTETLMRASLQWDVGTLASLNKGTVFAGIGYEYWNNKFGNRHHSREQEPRHRCSTLSGTSEISSRIMRLSIRQQRPVQTGRCCLESRRKAFRRSICLLQSRDQNPA
jgi:nucleoside-specific outer membrane channel protein Tsx